MSCLKPKPSVAFLAEPPATEPTPDTHDLLQRDAISPVRRDALDPMDVSTKPRRFQSAEWVRVLVFKSLLVFGPLGYAEEPPAPIPCHVGIYVVSLSDVNLRDGTCVADFWVWFRWQNAAITPLETIEVIDGTIDARTGVLQKTLTNGCQYACHRIRATIRQKWNVAQFPLDTQCIVLALEDAALETGQLILLPDQQGSRISPDVSVPGWSLGTFAVSAQMQAYETNYGDTDLPPGAVAEYSRLIVTLDLYRPGMGLFFKLFTGLFVAVGIALVSIAIRPTDLDPRFGLPVGAMFASFASQYVIASVLPATSEFTLADQLHVLAVGVIFLVLLESVVSLFLTYADRTWVARRLDAVALVLLSLATITAVVILVMNARYPDSETVAGPIEFLPRGWCGVGCEGRGAYRMESLLRHANDIKLALGCGPGVIDIQQEPRYAKGHWGKGNDRRVVDLFPPGGRFTRKERVCHRDGPMVRPAWGVQSQFFQPTS